jgi:hypothetical protein
MALQRSLAKLCNDELTPVFEKVLNQFSPASGFLMIDRLDIDAGILPLKSLETELPRAVQEALERGLREIIPAETKQSDPMSMIGSTEHVSRNAQRIDSGEIIFKAFIHFLKTGRLPLSFNIPTETSLEEILGSLWQDGDSAELLPSFRGDLLHTLMDTDAQKRLSLQFSSGFQESVLEKLSPTSLPVIHSIFKILATLHLPESVLKESERQIWQFAFGKIAAGKNVTIGYISKKIVDSNTFLSGEWKDCLEKIELDLTAKRSNVISGKKKKQLHGEKDLTEYSKAQDPNKEKADKGRVKREHDSKEVPDNHRRSENHSHFETANKRIGENIQEGIYIQNAGLVILHPFLPQFFSTLGFASEAQLLQPERALCLLHFLATGQMIAPEYELILPKILCNVPLSYPVQSDVALTASERAEAVALLEAVVRHWDALRNSSSDGLRGSFLVRNGKLTPHENGDWLLQVESMGFDILMDQLPWGISTIQLPWMRKMLWVEWR